MNLTVAERFGIEPQFLSGSRLWTWSQVHWGIVHGMVAHSFARDVAAEASRDPAVAPECLAILVGEPDDSEEIEELVRTLADTEGAEGPDDRDVWLRVVLAWIASHIEQFSDPLAAVEWLYSEYNYPEWMASLVGYMPESVGERVLSPDELVRRIQELIGDTEVRSGLTAS